MKKLLIFTLVIVVGALLLFQQGGKSRSGEGLTLAEAAFSVRGAESVDSTSFLVGKFACQDGSKLVFDGCGGLKRISVNLTESSGSYSLTEAPDGAAVVRLELDGKPALYTFRLTSPEGDFSLTDAANVTQTFSPAT